MTTESDIMRRIQVKLSSVGARLFRNNTGLAWQGKVQRFPETRYIEVHPTDIVIRNARPVHFGLCDGSSDLVGWTKDGRFCAVESKNTTKPTQEQVNFIGAVNWSGGVGFIAHSPEEALQKYLQATE